MANMMQHNQIGYDSLFGNGVCYEYWGRFQKFGRLVGKALASVLLLTAMTSCVIMEQTKHPVESSTANNQLASSVKLIRIDANTIKDLLESEVTSDKAAGSSLPLPIDDWEYQIGPGDVLSIVVWDHPQLTIPAGAERSAVEAGNMVRPDGTIFYPYVGALDVSGKTLSEVRLALSEGLRNVIPNPQVDVSVARFSAEKIQLTGAVASPGSVPVTDLPLTLLDALEYREGLLTDSDVQNVKLIRDNQEYSINLKQFLEAGKGNQNPQLIGDDVVIVPRLINNEVYVMGEVDTPGVVPFNGQPLNLTQAVASSSGISKTTADASGIFVFRPSVVDQQIAVYQLDATDPAALLLGTRFQLIRGDVVYVTSAPATRWNRIIGNIIPSLGALTALLFIGDGS